MMTHRLTVLQSPKLVILPHPPLGRPASEHKKSMQTLARPVGHRRRLIHKTQRHPTERLWFSCMRYMYSHPTRHYRRRYPRMETEENGIYRIIASFD